MSKLATGEVLEIYRKGLIFVSICTNIEDRKRIVKILNKQHPTGIDSQWDFSEDLSFNGGEPNPSPCDKGTDNLHYLMSC